PGREQLLQLEAGGDLVVIGDRDVRLEAESAVDLRDLGVEDRARADRRMPPALREIDRLVPGPPVVELPLEPSADHGNPDDVGRNVRQELARMMRVRMQRNAGVETVPVGARYECPQAGPSQQRSIAHPTPRQLSTVISAWYSGAPNRRRYSDCRLYRCTLIRRL